MELRESLETELADLEEELSAHGRSVGEDGDWEGSSNEGDDMESDPIDAADQIEELATNVPLVEQLEDRYKEVEEARERMTAGTAHRALAARGVHAIGRHALIRKRSTAMATIARRDTSAAVGSSALRVTLLIAGAAGHAVWGTCAVRQVAVQLARN